MTGICDSCACCGEAYVVGGSWPIINCSFQITGGDPGTLFYGEGVAHPVLQVYAVQAQQDHPLSGWCERRTIPDCAPAWADCHERGLHKVGSGLQAWHHVHCCAEETSYKVSVFGNSVMNLADDFDFGYVVQRCCCWEVIAFHSEDTMMFATYRNSNVLCSCCLSQSNGSAKE